MERRGGLRLKASGAFLGIEAAEWKAGRLERPLPEATVSLTWYHREAGGLQPGSGGAAPHWPTLGDPHDVTAAGG